MLKILRSKSRRKFVFTLCWPWLGDAFARSKCSHHGTCFINWIKENFTVLKRKLKLNPKSAWNIEFNIVRCTWCVHYGSIFSSNLHESCLINRIKSFPTHSKQRLKLRPKPGRNIIGLSDVHNVEIQFLCRLRLRIELQFLFQNSKILFDSGDKQEPCW